MVLNIPTSDILIEGRSILIKQSKIVGPPSLMMEPNLTIWQMDFNTDKCEVLYFGKSNQGRTYTVNGRALGSVQEQRDLGVHVHSSLKAESQVDKVVKKAFSTLAFSQGIEYRSWDIMLQLYKSLVRLHFGHPVIGKSLINWKECREDLRGCCQD